MTSRVAVHGGYVYDVTLDLKKRSRWVTDKNGTPTLVSNGQDLGVFFLESSVFSKNLSRLAEFATAAKNADKAP